MRSVSRSRSWAKASAAAISVPRARLALRPARRAISCCTSAGPRLRRFAARRAPAVCRAGACESSGVAVGALADGPQRGPLVAPPAAGGRRRRAIPSRFSGLLVAAVDGVRAEPARAAARRATATSRVRVPRRASDSRPPRFSPAPNSGTAVATSTTVGLRRGTPFPGCARRPPLDDRSSELPVDPPSAAEPDRGSLAPRFAGRREPPRRAAPSRGNLRRSSKLAAIRRRMSARLSRRWTCPRCPTRSAPGPSPACRLGDPSHRRPTCLPRRGLGPLAAALHEPRAAPLRGAPLRGAAFGPRPSGRAFRARRRLSLPPLPARFAGGRPGHLVVPAPSCDPIGVGRMIERTDTREERPRRCSCLARRGRFEKSRRRPTLPGGSPPSTIGAGGLHFRVRNGNGCFPAAIATGNLWNCQRRRTRMSIMISPQ